MIGPEAMIFENTNGDGWACELSSQVVFESCPRARGGEPPELWAVYVHWTLSLRTRG
jgi:hypothetical protein